MKLSPAIIKETKHITIGVLLGDVLMIAVFALLKKLDYTVFLGALLGTAAAILNFFAMGVRAQKAMADPDRAAMIIRRSYTVRMLFMVAVMAVGVAAPCFHVVAVVLPYLFPSITIKMMHVLGMFKPEEKGGEADQ